MRLTLVGRDPSSQLRSAAERAGVALTGTVADVRDYLRAAAVVVVPMRIGGGTRLKIFEALAMGKAVVSMTVGAEGLPLISGSHYVRADEPRQFAREVVKLLGDPARRQQLGAAGRELVETRYTWEVVTREFEHHLAEAVELSRPSRPRPPVSLCRGRR